MRRPVPHRALPTLWLGAALALLGGCGGSAAQPGIASQSAARILAAARAAAAGAATVHVHGVLAGAGGPLRVDLRLVSGKGGQGTIADGEVTFRLIEVGSYAYLKGNPLLYRRLGAPLAGELRGAWLKAKTRAGLAPFASLTNLRRLVDTALTSHGTPLRKSTGTVDGRPVLAIGDLAAGGTLYVAARGTPYPVRLRTARGGALAFDRWNQPVTLTAPTDAVNVNQLVVPR